MKTFRIGMLRISQETNAFSPLPTEVPAFKHYRRGDDLMHATSRWGREVEGAMWAAELSGFRRAVERHGGSRCEVVPVFSAWAFPGGPLTTSAVAHFCEDLKATLAAAGPLDALFFCLHGALACEEGTSPEETWLRQIRDQLGEIPIAVSADLHANITPALIELSTLLCAYRTNPHRDHKHTGYRVGRLLVRTLFGEVTPTKAWRFLPMVQGGGTTIDFLPTMRPLFRQLSSLEKRGEVLDASLFMVHPWLRNRELGWAIVVTTDGDPEAADRVAEQLAEQAWSVRHSLPPEFPGPEQALEQARRARVRRRFGTVCICDASDVVGAGAPGTNTALLRVLLEQGQGLLSYGVIRDALTVEDLWERPIGSWVQATVGGREPGASPALEVRGTLKQRDEDVIFGRTVTLDLGHLQLVVAADPPLVMRPSFYRMRGLRPSKADICIVKSFFPFRMFFALYNRKTIFVKTHGATDLDRGWGQDFIHPTHPTDDPEDWRPADRARRGTPEDV